MATPYIARASFAKSSLQYNSTSLQDLPTIASITKQAQEQKPTSKPTTTTTTPSTAATTTPSTAATTTTTTASSSSQNVKGSVKVAFVDSYWTDNAAPEAVVAGSSSSGTTTIPAVIRQEVGPGEGPSTLVVVLVNRGFSDITGITGSLQLPSEFEPIITAKRSGIPGADSQTALSSYNGIVSAGQTFTFYFPVNVLKDAQAGKQYVGDLKIGYFDVSEQNSKNSRSQTITVPFTLPGKVVLDAVSGSASSFSSLQTLNLVPDTPNVIKLTIRNNGSATANGVVVTISGVGSTANTNSINTNTGNSSSGSAQQSSSPSTVNLGTTTFNIGTIIAGRNATIDPVIYPSISAAGTVQSLNLDISYNDAYGNKKTSNQLIGLQIVPSSPQSGLSVSPSSSFFSSSASSSSTAAVAFSSSSANNSNTNNDPIDPKQLPNLPASNTSPSIIQITAGKIQDLKFTINNNNNPTTGSIPNSITDLAVSLVSQSNSVRILGPSSWNLQNIRPQSAQELSTQVFASPSLIGNPIFFTVNLQYIQNGHQLKTASFNLGAVIVGDIKISANDIAIRYIGDTPYLVGNLLNEGNTVALFTNVEMLNQGQIETQQPSSSTSFPSHSSTAINENFKTTLLPVSSEYVGNLAENSPVSFRIPLKIVQVPTTAGEQSANNNSTQNTTTVRPTGTSSSSATSPSITIGYNNNTVPGIYPVSLKITYTDDLKNSHELVINKTISIDFGQTQAGTLGQQQLMQQSIFTNGFIDSYWAANTAVNGGGSITGNSSATGTSASSPPQEELGPGDGKATLAIVLSNTGFSDINGILGYLTLPSGFSAASDSGTTISNNQNDLNLNQNQQQMQLLEEPAIAGLNNVVKAGQTYTLYFKVNILKTAIVGSHSASLRLNYFEVPELEPGKYSSETFTIPFTLPGKVILDAAPKTADLTPGISNEPKIEIRNIGSADAHGVIVTVTGVSENSITSGVGSSSGSSNDLSNSSSNTSPSGGVTTTTTSPSSIPTVNLGARTFDIGTIPVNGTTEISPVIYPSDSAGGTLQNLNLQLAYSDANGDTKSSNISVGFRVLPTPPETGLSVTPSNTTTSSSNTNPNNNPGISVSPPHATSSNTNPSDNYHNAAAFFFTPSLQRSYAENNNNLNNTSLILVAGKMEDMTFDITNNNDFPITNVVISISSQSNDLKIIGDSLWSLQSLSPHSKHTFSTKVYASTSLIGSPVSFIVTTQYISGEQSKIGSFSLGGTVVGDIKVSVTDLAVNYIAGTPNLVGNLLNEGNTVALFTKVQMLNQPFFSSGEAGSRAIPSSSVSNGTSSSYSPPQYLGDLQPDSPLPFSIPINVDNSTAPGIYPVSLKIAYSDDLKNSHELVINNTVTIKPEQRQQPNDRGINSFGGRGGILGIPFPIIIAIIAAIAIVAVIIIVRRRKSTGSKNLVASQVEQERSNNSDEDIESLIDDDRSSDKRNDYTSDRGEIKHGS